MLLEIKDYPAALSLLSKLLSEVKKLDDKLLLVDIYLLESQVPPRLHACMRVDAGGLYMGSMTMIL